MKEATGDLSMTAVAIVAIAAIAAVFTMLIWPNIRNTIIRNTHCAQALNCGPCIDGIREGCEFINDNDERQLIPGGCPCERDDE